ncbi:hypothetical protein BCR41DRAFT_402185 [Lobosporangium transversale]|uniref:Uncharacterized protein n=1 Tax=Lobosporangium transversale TaxID=64571 RepID=A0A1Y2G5T3_9FUNG|nr:hypothetical protein BCR41DRAFT_402185 [Lobosporangium transversale]ORY96028.1 hypothetical protein BCR41DRAFT_402185 [Lobosporangium transversale]|eukprot:XP_021875460.1 hypothetical protein BCR41DRAFT_402185 [Lobosporangium transversale]
MTANKPEDASILNKRKRKNQHPQRKKRAIPLLLVLNCVVEGEATPFPVEIFCDKSVGILKEVIKAKKANALNNIDADQLTLYKVSIPDKGEAIFESEIKSKEALTVASKELGNIFNSELPKETIHVFVKPPQRAQKRKQDGDSESPSKKARPSMSSRGDLMDAITEAGLVTKGIVDGGPTVSPLNSKERVKVLSYMGGLPADDPYKGIISVARELRNSGGIKDSKILTAPEGRIFPVAGTRHLYIRDEYKELYGLVTSGLSTPHEVPRLNRLFITGTPGIGKSAFLVYFAIRLLAEHDEENPPIIIFQEKQHTKCYVYGGTTCQRKGNITMFEDFLARPETWYLVDSGKDPQPGEARTIFSASPRTLYGHYDELTKENTPDSYYHMSLWSLDELKECRANVKFFHVVSEAFLEELFYDLGGVPRQVLQCPADVLSKNQKHTERARKSAFQCVNDAIGVTWLPSNLSDLFREGDEAGSCLLHRVPTSDHLDFHLVWASPYVRSRIIMKLRDQTWIDVLKRLVKVGSEIEKGPSFELYVHYLIRCGGLRFPFKDLQSDETGFFDLPRDSSEITVSEKHPIKQAPFKKIIDYIIGPCSKGNRSKSKGSDDTIFFYFVVPGYMYDNFKVQKFVINDSQDAKAIPGYLKHVRQRVIKIDTEAAYSGGAAVAVKVKVPHMEGIPRRFLELFGGQGAGSKTIHTGQNSHEYFDGSLENNLLIELQQLLERHHPMTRLPKNIKERVNGQGTQLRVVIRAESQRDLRGQGRSESMRLIHHTTVFTMFPCIRMTNVGGGRTYGKYKKEIRSLLSSERSFGRSDSEDIEDDWMESHESRTKKIREFISQRECYAYRLQIRPMSSTGQRPYIWMIPRLTHQHIVGQYYKLETFGLLNISMYQSKLKADAYIGIVDAIDLDLRPENIEKRVILPSSFVGEIQEALYDGQTAADRPDLCVRVFNLKKKALEGRPLQERCLGKVIVYNWVVEFQKPGLPHQHLFIILDDGSKPRTVDDINSIVSAEIPDRHSAPLAHEAVISHMIHGPCGVHNPQAPLKSAHAHSWEIAQEVRMAIRLIIDSVDQLHQSSIYKYMHKGHDRALVAIVAADGGNVNLDEVNNYRDNRYVSTYESLWRMYGFALHGQSHNVRLAAHLEDQQQVVFDPDKIFNC